MRSSRLSRRERRALSAHHSPVHNPSTAHLAGSVLALGALASVSILNADAARADAIRADVATPESQAAPRLAQANLAQAGIAPRVTIVQPAYADLLKGNANIVIAVDAKGSATKSVQMFVDGVSATEGPIPLNGLNSAQFDWKTSTVKDGLHRLIVRVTDENGLRGEAETQVYINNSRTRDTSSPTLKWQNVRSGEMLHGQAELQLGASDNFGVKYIVITVNPIDNPDRTPALRASIINRAPFTYSLDTTRLPDGIYVLNARGYDVLDNEGATQRVTFGVSNNGLNPTVLEQLKEVIASTKLDGKPAKSAATKKPTSSTRTSSTRVETETKPATSTRAALRIKPPVAKTPSAKTPPAKTPQAVADNKTEIAKVTAPKVPVTNVVTAKIVIKAAPVRVANVKPSIALQAPSISQPTLTRIASGSTEVKASSVGNASSAKATFEETVPRKISQPTLTNRSSAARLAANVTEAKSDVSTKIARTSTLKTEAAPTQFDSRNAEVVSSRIALAAPSSSVVVSQRSDLPQVATRFAKNAVVQTPVAKTVVQNSAHQTPAMTGLPLPEAATMSASITAPSQTDSGVIEYSNTARISLSAHPRIAQTPRVAPMPRIARVEKPLPVAAVARKTESLPVETRATSVAPTATNSIKLAPSTVVSTRDVAPTSAAKTTIYVKTPQRMAALPTRRDDDNASSMTFAAAQSGARKAAITVSPVTLAALQSRGAAGTLPAIHVVKRGETMSSLAARYGLRAETLANVNGLKSHVALAAGQKLNLPRALKVAYRGADGSGDAQAFMVGSTGVAPLRFLFEQQGGTMTWDEAAQRVTASNGARRVSINIGSREASVDDQKVMMDLAAFLLSGRTMVPIRFFEKAFDTRVEWEPATSRIYVAMSNDDALTR